MEIILGWFLYLKLVLGSDGYSYLSVNHPHPLHT